MATIDISQGRRVELILRQIDALPTLPSVATRLLQLTASSDAESREVIELVASDPALTAKVLALCRSADKGIRSDIVTVDRAVVLLGFTAIRNAVLSIKVFEVFGQLRAEVRSPRADAGDEDAPPPRPAAAAAPTGVTGASGEDPFNRVEFWRHSLAVALAAELIAKHQRDAALPPEEAFVCGLLHDIGKLALDHVLPKAFARVVHLADLHQANIAELERKVMGIDHHTAGKRLAEQWGLPHVLQDCIWLHGSPYDTLPRLEHRRLIGLVSLADLVARRQHTGYSGNYVTKGVPEKLAAQLEIDPRAPELVVPRLHEELERRGRAMGLYDEPSEQLFLRSIQRANEQLGRLNTVLERRGHAAATQARVLDAISTFHAQDSPGRSVQDTLDAVVGSAAAVLGPGYLGALLQLPALAAPEVHVNTEDDDDAPRSPRRDAVGFPHHPQIPTPQPQWFFCQYGPDLRPQHAQHILPPDYCPDLSRLDANDPAALHVMSILPWLSDFLVDVDDLRHVRLLPLSSGWGTAAVLLHDRATLPGWAQLSALASTWGAAIAAAVQHEGARRLGEQLAESNHALSDAQDRLLQAQSLARLGEMAAGAAHEMNNPLAVIAGRSQLLTLCLPGGTKEHKAAQTIFEQAHRLSDLITSLRLLAAPPRARRRVVDVQPVLDEAIKKAQQHFGRADRAKPVYLQVRKGVPPIALDAQMLSQAVQELVLNALAAQPRQSINVTAALDEPDDRLVIQVADDGVGMDEHTLSHALDPFFSAKPAGRQMGMGLPRAKQWVLAHGGDLGLRSTPGQGTVATIWIPLHVESAPVAA